MGLPSLLFYTQREGVDHEESISGISGIDCKSSGMFQ
jgi:hypothetical protein